MNNRRKITGWFYETALPNEYLVEIGTPNIEPVLGGKRFKMFKRFLRVPAYVQTLHFTANNANMDFQGIGVDGYASWHINPDNPRLAITTLDFFDENDPMAKTNGELKTICVEAVRYVISNMTIEDALKKKDEISQSLKNQLKEVEKKWGIVFDQVGIEKITILSSRLFEDLQSQFRNQLRFEVEKNRIKTDSEIATERNTLREKTELERYTVDQKLQLIDIENKTRIKEREIEESKGIAHKERAVREENYRKELAFNMEKEQKEHELKTLEKTLQIKLIEVEKMHLEAQKTLELTQNEMAKSRLELQKLQRDVEQAFTQEALSNKFIESLPQIYNAIKIQNYSVLDSNGGGIAPVGKFLQELLFMFKNSNFGPATTPETKE